MDIPILTTKLFIPPVRSDLLPRPQLTRRLEQSAGYPLTLISASAGSGKTTLLSEWVTGTAHPVAWISLDPDDNDPTQFFSYVIYAFRRIKADFGDGLLNTIRSDPSGSLDTSLIHLINELAELPDNSFLILDDYHTITDTQIHDLLLFLVDHLPRQVHLIIASRVDPPWPFSRYRARNQLQELRGQDLRFDTAETKNFLDRTIGLDLSLEDVTALEQRTEGWAAGLQLAALSMQGHGHIPEFVKDFTGSHLYVAEYLVEEILKQQPEDIKSFLLQTSLLERLNSGLCETVTECQDGKAVLDKLHRANVFMVPLDHQGQWYRYHHLFADLLQSQLQQNYSKAQIGSLHTRAAAWFERNQFFVEAVHHTFAAQDNDKAAAMVDQHGQKMFFAERYNVLKNWLDALPDPYLQAYPRLEIYRLLLDLLKGTLDMFEQTLVEKEKLIKSLPSSPENDRLRRRALINLSLFYAFQNTTRAIEIAEEALAEVPEEDLQTRAYLYSVFYRAYGMEGDIHKSAAAYRESFRLAEITGQYEMISNTTKIRTFDLCQYGRLDESADYCQRIIAVGEQRKTRTFYPAGPCYVGLGGIYLERNDLEKAEEYITLGLQLCQQGAMYGLFTGHVQKVRLLQAKGEIQNALKELQLLEQTFQRREFTLMAQKVSLLLAAGDLQAASDLVPELEKILGVSHYAQNLPIIAAESFKLSLARILIARNETEKANQLLDEIQETVEPGLRYGRLMEVYLLRALACQRRAPEEISMEAVAFLEQALNLAEGPGFMMLLLEEGSALIPLLQAVVKHRSAAGRVRKHAHKLLQAFGDRNQAGAAFPTAEVEELVEQLTPREMEVLLRIAAGDSNQEIAEKLVVTVRTVKKHTSNIYGKLNVSSRTQAVAYARKIGLLPAD